MDIVAGDMCDPDCVARAVRDVDAVFHLAALIAIPYSYEAPDSYVRTNVEGTLNLLQASRNAGVARFVHTSTSEVYGTARYVPIDEEHPLQGQSPYSASKIGADKMAEAFHRSFGLPVVTVRPFNTFGPRQSARAVIPTIITQCLTSETISLGNLHPTRDLNFVSNTVDGYLLAATHEDAVGHTINLGSGREMSIGELVEMLTAIVGRPRRGGPGGSAHPAGGERGRAPAGRQRARAAGARLDSPGRPRRRTAAHGRLDARPPRALPPRRLCRLTETSAGTGSIPLCVPFLGGNERAYVTYCVDTSWVSSVGPFVDSFERSSPARHRRTTPSPPPAARRPCTSRCCWRASSRTTRCSSRRSRSSPRPTPSATSAPGRCSSTRSRTTGRWTRISSRAFLEDDCETIDGVLPRQAQRPPCPRAAAGAHPRAPRRHGPILELATRYGLVVVEDATEALGATYKDRAAGHLAPLGCFSFNGNKIITTGGGGVIITDRSDWADRARYLTTQAKDDPLEYVHDEIGYNYRLTNVQAALGAAQLEQLDHFVAAKRRIAAAYERASGTCPASPARRRRRGPTARTGCTPSSSTRASAGSGVATSCDAWNRSPYRRGRCGSRFTAVRRMPVRESWAEPSQSV